MSSIGSKHLREMKTITKGKSYLPSRHPQIFFEMLNSHFKSLFFDSQTINYVGSNRFTPAGNKDKGIRKLGF